MNNTILTNAAGALEELISVAAFILIVVGMFFIKNWLHRRKVEKEAKIFAKEMNKKIQSIDTNAPTVDAALMVRAKWILQDGKGNGVCSACNRQDRIDPLATHCRYCGAIMNKE